MLSLQLSGLHMHANAHGEPSGLHGPHVHDLDSDGHDHRADVNILVFDSGIVWSTLSPLPLLILSFLLAVIWTPEAVRRPPVYHLRLRHRCRWRPPLRAPPLTL